MLARTTRLSLFALAGALALPCAQGIAGSGPVAWQEAYLKSCNTGGGGQIFGSAVAIFGDTIAVGAQSENGGAIGVNGDPFDPVHWSDSGAVYVFVRTGTTWAQEAYIKASNRGLDDRFGTSVALHGDTLAVGARGERSSATGVNGDEDSNDYPQAGAAYVFVRSGTTWSQQAYLKASNTARDDNFGGAVSLHGDTIVVGAPGEDSNATGVNGLQADNTAFESGAAYVFVRSGTTWSQEAYLKASNTGTEDGFGNSVAVSGDTLVVGASKEDGSATGIDGDGANNGAVDAGAAYVFTRSGTAWAQGAYVKASNTNAWDNFGKSVALSGDTFVVGARHEGSASTVVNQGEADNSAYRAGAAYVFVRGGSTWSQEAYLKAANTESTDHFGLSASICGDVVVIGASGEAGGSSGVNGDAASNALYRSGAAYVYTRTGTDWSQLAYLKASAPDIWDRFGGAVCVSGELVVAGAHTEASNAVGVNGDDTNNSSGGAGAAYLFALDGLHVEAFCAGDGSGAACPCANDSDAGSGEGCRNSAGHGALLSATGTPSVLHDLLELRVEGATPSEFGIFVQGITPIAGAAFFDGLLCLPGDPHLVRHYAPPAVLPTVTDTGGTGVNAQPLTVGDFSGDTQAGVTIWYQYWYRDNAGPCGTGASFSSGLGIPWLP